MKLSVQWNAAYVPVRSQRRVDWDPNARPTEQYLAHLRMALDLVMQRCQTCPLKNYPTCVDTCPYRKYKPGLA